MAEQLSNDHLDITITPVWDEAAESTEDDESFDADDEDELEDERRTVDLTGHGADWAERLPKVQGAISALEGIRVEATASADLPAEDSANEGEES